MEEAVVMIVLKRELASKVNQTDHRTSQALSQV